MVGNEELCAIRRVCKIPAAKTADLAPILVGCLTAGNGTFGPYVW